MKVPRIMIAGASSGSGKTTAVCAILSLLKRRGLAVKACKCGPDYIDPMFHKTVSGVPCTNLDPFFCNKDLMRYLLCRNAGEDITVIEGVMGYYDGTGPDGTDNSSFTVASRTETPAILVIDGKSSAASLLAAAEGFLHFMPESRIMGVLFSRMSPMNYKNVSGLMQKRFGDALVPVGFIPDLPEDCRIPSRHLGLVTAAEIKDLEERIGKTAGFCEETIDIDAILSIAGEAPELAFTAPVIPRFKHIDLAVARDEAFCFYYGDTLSLFEEMGASIRFFSPLAGETVPENSDGLIIGGGYPELYTERLEANEGTKASIRKAVASGMPVIAECGGFQYLGRRLNGREMCGVLEHSSEDAGRLVRFGYITLSSLKEGLFGPAGTAFRAHEFHYFDSTDSGSDFAAAKPDGRQWHCAVTTDTMYAGYPHLFLPSSIPAAAEFYRKCLRYRENRG